MADHDFAPSFTQKPQLRQEDDGNRLVFECQLIAKPKPAIEWYRSEELLSQNSRTKFKIQNFGENKYFVVLELDDVIDTDAGLYKVKAKNRMGEVSASINLNFSREYLLGGCAVSSCFNIIIFHHVVVFINLLCVVTNDNKFVRFVLRQQQLG